MTRNASTRISPTAYATGAFWVRHGLSHPVLATRRGRQLDRAFGLLIQGTRAVSGVSLEALMLARHRGIDALLARAIEDGRVGQVIELAAGLSGRGLRFKQRYGNRLMYVETDLPAMVELKQSRLRSAGLLSAGHRMVTVDVLAADGPESLTEVAATLDPDIGTAIVTEGLMNYLPPPAAQDTWRRIAATLEGFPSGLYLADFYLTGENLNPAMLTFGAALSTFVRSRIHTHFHSVSEAVTAMHSFGFEITTVHRTADIPALADLAGRAGADRVRVLEASTTRARPSQRQRSTIPTKPRRRKPPGASGQRAASSP